ncbi:FHA domain-containing protein [Humisphaera borealis]|uniref:FHA domain-containing protein n=1 Tax=Humisphaera borealis TaxID=2807512 RepID=A0A7M2X0J4_9BACT|nr:FHA domain-containing protein [Humisphaera borealis]QOV90270.1 FHA domain-containing protein [Humisphaera borealis]
MSMTILIRHLANSSLAGQSREFQQATIRLGRKPDNDVVFNPELDLTVSGHHCQIVAEGDRLFVEDPGSTNGTFVNGQRVQGRTPITERDQIVLGERGPVIAASLKTADAAGPSTIMGSVSGGAMGNAMGMLDAGADLPPGAPMAATIPPVAIPYGPASHAQAAQGLSIGPVTPVHNVSRPPSRLSQGAKTSIGMNTLMSELDKATNRERRRIFVLGIPILILLAGGLGAAWYFTKPPPAQVIVQPAPPAPPPQTMPTLPPEWSAVLSPRKSAIYLMVLQRPGMEERGLGTAWSCAKGYLGTNSHVAAEFFNKPDNATLIARSNTNPPVDLKIAGATLHPGYVAFENLVRTQPPVDLESGKPIVFAMPFDTALFKVEEADLPKQAPPLELADDATLAKVVETTELAYIGFPMEASVESGVNLKAPVAHQFLGNLTRKTDIFLAATTEERATFLQYTLVVQGGASGSPVFNREGKVVGLISGNDHFFSESGRIAITGKSFGPRVDAIRDLLDKTAETKAAPYVLEYRKHFRAIFDKALAGGKYDARKFQPAFGAFEVLGIIRSNLPGNQGPPFKPGKADKKKTWTIDLEDVGDAAGKSITSFPMTDAGIYCVVVWTDNPDVLPKVTLPAIESNMQQLPPAALKVFQQKLGQGSSFVASWAMMRNVGDTLQFRVSGIANGDTKKAKMTAVLMKAAE